MISIKDLSVSYNRQTKVIDSLNLDLVFNAIHGIVGLNGAGKTTLLNTLYGLLNPSAGQITANDRKPTKREMSYLATENFFYTNITGREYLSLFSNSQFDNEKWNQLFSLPLDALIDSYSTGMKKKLAIMGVIKQDKPIMVLDEPFNGLDLESCRNLRSILLRLKENGKTIIVTSHVIETLTNLCDQIHFLAKGKIEKSIASTEFGAFEKELYATIEQRNLGLIDSILP